ncbi:MAG: ATP-binding protein [Pseudomonadota bacterium]
MSKSKGSRIAAAALLTVTMAFLFVMAGIFTEIGVAERDAVKKNDILEIAVSRAIDAAASLESAKGEADQRAARDALLDLSAAFRRDHIEALKKTNSRPLARALLSLSNGDEPAPNILLQRQLHALAHAANLLAISQSGDELATRASRVRELAANLIPQQLEKDVGWREAQSDRAFGAARLTVFAAVPILVVVMFGLWRFVIRPQRRRELEALRRLRSERDAARAEAAEAKAASVAKTRFIGTMSHEIRTPMNGVIGLAEVLRTSIKDPELKTLASTLKDSGVDLLRILNDVLDFTKIEAGKMELVEGPFAAADLAAKMRALHAAEAQEKGVALRVRATGGGAFARVGDSHRICQILNNLIGNAIKFTDEGGAVEVEIDDDPVGALTLAVRDTGVGMTPEEARAAVTEYAQAGDDIERKAAGTGLGLSIVKRLAEQMGGALDIRGAKGVGVTATVRLPLAFAAANEAPVRAPFLVASDGAARPRLVAAGE